MYPIPLLNKIKWTGNAALDGISVCYVSRGDTGDEVTVSGEEIVDTFRSFIQVKRKDQEEMTLIPSHRIKSISRDGKVIWDVSDPKQVKE